ncbi:MAG: hypothetical protein AB7E80_16470 [Hyphomicrobiaceae bacterium]
MADNAHQLPHAGATTSVIDWDTQRRLRQLMKRDRVDWRTFLRRAVEAYDLMYSRSE